MILFIITSVAYFGIMTLIAQSNAPQEYNTKINTLSELGCQYYEKNSIMQWAYKGFGIILVSGSLITISNYLNQLYFLIPLALYGVFMFLSGIYSIKPFEHLVFYSVKESKKHILFSQLAGLSFALLIVMKFIIVLGLFNRVINIIVLVTVLYLSALAGRSSGNKGFYQRALYTVSFLWLIYAYSVALV